MTVVFTCFHWLHVTVRPLEIWALSQPLYSSSVQILRRYDAEEFNKRVSKSSTQEPEKYLNSSKHVQKYEALSSAKQNIQVKECVCVCVCWFSAGFRTWRPTNINQCHHDRLGLMTQKVNAPFLPLFLFTWPGCTCSCKWHDACYSVLVVTFWGQMKHESGRQWPSVSPKFNK